MRHSVKKSGGAMLLLSLPGAIGGPDDLLSTLFQSSTVGVAICDRQLRFQAINDALASMNGLPAAAHLGKTLHAVLGKAAAKVVPGFERVFATGKVVSNIEITAKLLLRCEPSHWNESYFPIKDSTGQVFQVGAIVLEIGRDIEVAGLLQSLTETLNRVSDSLRDHRASVGPLGSGDLCREVLTSSQAVVNNCLYEARAILERLRDAPHIRSVQPLGTDAMVKTGLSSAGQEQDPVHAQVDPLSAREREVAALLADGKTNKQIGSLLTISTRTVESHRAKIMLKLDLHSLSDLVRYALHSKLIEP